MIESLRDRKKLFTVSLIFLLILLALCFWVSYSKHIIMSMILFVMALATTVWGIEETWKKKTTQF